MKKKIIVILYKGIVQEVRGIPEGCQVEVRDYDVMNYEEGDVLRDEVGDEYAPSLFLAPPKEA